jgi:hypothetical protein
VPEAEHRHYVLALEFVFVTFNYDQAIAKYTTQKVPDGSWFFIIIGILDQNFAKRLWGRQNESRLMAKRSKHQYSVVRNSNHPFKEILARRLLEQ